MFVEETAAVISDPRSGVTCSCGQETRSEKQQKNISKLEAYNGFVN